MEIDNKIIIKTLGNCSIACRDKIISDKDVSSKKFWTALGYLVINRYRPIPSRACGHSLSRRWSNNRKRFKTLFTG